MKDEIAKPRCSEYESSLALHFFKAEQHKGIGRDIQVQPGIQVAVYMKKLSIP